MMLPNSCAVSAHQRIHKHRAPHVCPECGGVARQGSFQTHLDEACLHFARRIGFRFGRPNDGRVAVAQESFCLGWGSEPTTV